MTKLLDMTGTEIQNRIWSTKDLSEHVRLRDIFTDDEIFDLLDHECFSQWADHFKSWVMNTADLIAKES